MNPKLKYLAAVGTIVLMVSLLHLPHTKDATPSPQNRPVCDLNRVSRDVALPSQHQSSAGQTAPEMPPQNTAFIGHAAAVTEQETQPMATHEKEESAPVEAPQSKQTEPSPPAPARPAEPQMGDTRWWTGKSRSTFSASAGLRTAANQTTANTLPICMKTATRSASWEAAPLWTEMATSTRWLASWENSPRTEAGV